MSMASKLPSHGTWFQRGEFKVDSEGTFGPLRRDEEMSSCSIDMLSRSIPIQPLARIWSLRRSFMSKSASTSTGRLSLSSLSLSAGSKSESSLPPANSSVPFAPLFLLRLLGGVGGFWYQEKVSVV